MSASIKGRFVVWGITAGVISLVNSVTASGIIQSASISGGGGTDTITDEDGDHVTRIDHGGENKINVEVICEPNTTVPVKGSELTGLGNIDGINFNAGRVFVDDPKVDYTNAQGKKLSFTATHYPEMPADTITVTV